MSEKHEEFVPRPAFTIDWIRQYDCGPSDEHLHAIGQFLAIYSNIEWQVADLFAHFIGMTAEEAQQMTATTNLSFQGMERYVRSSIEKDGAVSAQVKQDLIHTLKSFGNLSSTRHKVVHWQWGLNEGMTATLSNLIKPKPNKSEASMSVDQLRAKCREAILIFYAIYANTSIITGRKTREELLADHNGPFPEKLFRA